MRAKMFISLAALLVAGIVVAASAGSVAAQEGVRPDCPGEVVCPLTGEPVCLDRCPVPSADQTRETDTPVCCPPPR